MGEERKKKIAFLADHGIFISEEAGIGICAPCSLPFPRNHTVRHCFGHKPEEDGFSLEPARKTRRLSNDPSEKEEIDDIRARSFKNRSRLGKLVKELIPENHVHRAKYIEIPTIAEGIREPVPEIEHLVVIDGFQCPRCSFIEVHPATVRRHIKKNKGHQPHSDISEKEISNLKNVKAQRLTAKKGTGFFFEILSTEFPECRLASGANQIMNELAQKVYEGILPSSSQRDFSDHECSAFVSIAQPQKRIQEYGLNIAQAGQILKLDSSMHQSIHEDIICKTKKALQKYITKAEKYAKDDAHTSVLKNVGAPGFCKKTNSFTPVQQKSKVRYISSFVPFLWMLLNIFSKKSEHRLLKLPKNLEKAISALIRGLQSSSPDDLVQEIHTILCESLLRKITLGEFKSITSAYLACLCVDAREHDNPRYRMGIEVSPFLSALLYISSCAALTYIMESFANEKEHLSIEARSDNIRRQFANDAVSINAQICRLRNICYQLRDQENARETFTPCQNPKHAGCGVVRGEHISFEQIGQCVSKIHSEIWKNIASLVGPRTISKRMVDHFNSFDDNLQEFSSGYSFMSRSAAGKVLKHCNQIMANQIQRMNTGNTARDLASLQLWMQTARKTLSLILTAVHLTGGAPGRATELASILIQNTPVNIRGVFVNGLEVMITPGYTKSRSRRQGKVATVCRFPDRVTSLYRKVFLLMIRPTMLMYYASKPADGERNLLDDELFEDSETTDSENEDFPGEKDGESEDIDLREYLLAMKSSLFPRLSSMIGENMRRFGLNLTVSSYRQFYCGVSQRRTGHMGDLYFALRKSGRNILQDSAMKQASHSRQIGEQYYGQSSTAFGLMHDDSHEMRIEAFRELSRQWHIDIGLEPTSISSHIERNCKK